MEQKIGEFCRAEVRNEVQIRVAEYLETISGLYEIPVSRLIRDTVHLDPTFCKGINKECRRCLKKPRENGFCKFHRKQANEPEEKTEPEIVPAPWES
jgi:sulfatase maturation enzyme AslB (radical SAM superfamily)